MPSHISSRSILLIICVLVGACVLPSMQAAEQENSPTQSGYNDKPTLEGPGGVAAEVARDDIDTGAMLRIPYLDGILKPWFELKSTWNKKYGLKLNFSYQSLYQSADETLTGIDDGAAWRLQAQGLWTVLDRGGKNPGSISFRVEDRYRIEDIPPTQLGYQFGSGSLTGTGFSDFGVALTELAWRQTLLDGRMKFGFGKISSKSWYNAYALSSSMTGFQNSALQSSNTKASSGRGLGAVTGFRLGEKFAVIAGIHDANAQTAGNPFDTIIEGEFYYSAELRWFPTTFERHQWDQVRLQAWYVDAHNDGATPSGHGLSFAASRLFDDFYMPFVIAGVSDGDASVMKSDVTAGIGFAFNTVHRAARDVLALSVNLADPSDGALQEQFTSEIFYRFQLVKNIAITPSIQYIANPAYGSSQEDVWVGGIRLRMIF